MNKEQSVLDRLQSISMRDFDTVGGKHMVIDTIQDAIEEIKRLIRQNNE